MKTSHKKNAVPNEVPTHLKKADVVEAKFLQGHGVAPKAPDKMKFDDVPGDPA